MTDEEKGGWMALFFSFATTMGYFFPSALILGLLKIRKAVDFQLPRDLEGVWFWGGVPILSLFLFGLSLPLILKNKSKRF